MSKEQLKELELPQKWQPHPYQEKAKAFLLENAAAGLFLDPGLGKTSITLSAIGSLKEKGMLKKVLLIAPLRVCNSVWPCEVQKWLNFNNLKVVVLHGKDKVELLNTPADVYIINPEGLDWLFGKPISRNGKKVVDLSRWEAFKFDTLVIDELSKFKNINTSRFKLLKQVLRTFTRRWGLTGSPASNGLLDLFGQCYVLDEGRSLGTYITQYRMKYFDQGWNGFSWHIRPGAEKQIYERIKPLVWRMSAEDYLDMPELIKNNIQIELPPQAMRSYKQVEKDLIAAIDGGVVTALTAASASVKCRQIANGGIYLDQQLGEYNLPTSDKKWVDVHTAKIDALGDLVEELQGSPLLVAYEFEHDLERLKFKFGKDVPYIGGGVSSKRSSELVALWNKGQLPILLGHPQAMAHGLNLQEAGNHVCWFSLTWNYELYDQFIRRVLRQGNKSKKVFVHHIVAKGTIDEQVLIALNDKETGQNALFKALVSHYN